MIVVFTPDINLGNVISAVSFIGGTLFAFHKFDKKIDLRHQSNVDRDTANIKTMTRIERKLDDTADVAADLASEVKVHIAEDKIVHANVVNNLSEIKQDIGQIKDNRRKDN